MNLTICFTKEIVLPAKNYSDDPEEAVAPEGGGNFVKYTMISLHRLIAVTKIVETDAQAILDVHHSMTETAAPRSNARAAGPQVRVIGVRESAKATLICFFFFGNINRIDP